MASEELVALGRARFAHVDALLDEALSCDDAGRASLLARVEADDPDDARLLRRLLEHALVEPQGPASALELIPGVPAADGVQAPARAGEQLGNYVLDAPLGEGGMGTVYAARRVDGAYDTDVAIKIMHADLPASLADHFQRERQTLADLRHPGITQILDGGTTATGEPYLVMELVDGQALDAWAPQATLLARIDLLARVCDAVAHAHDQLVVHRDLKPSNVLVRPDGTPVVLDFGIATRPAADDPQTAARGPLSPRWAAPEQLSGAPVGVRADVFSLGLLLHCLVTGRFDVRRPLPPLSDLPAPSGAPEPGRRRRRELDAICRKATAEAPGDRYASVRALAEDLRRFLRRERIAARTDPGYRAFMWARSRAVALGVGALLMAGAGTYTLTLRQHADSLEAANERIQARRQESRLLADFLGSALTGPGSRPVEGKEPTIREALDRAMTRVDEEAPPPAARGAIEMAAAKAYASLGRFPVAAERAAEAERQFDLAGEHERRVDARLFRSDLLRKGYQHFEAEKVAESALALELELDDRRLRPRVAHALETRAQALFTLDHSRSAALYLRALVIRLLTGGPFGPSLSRSLLGLADMAKPPLGRWLADWAAHVRAARPDATYADVLHRAARLQDDRDRARRYYEQAAQIERDVLGPTHPSYANTLNDLGLFLEREDPEASVAYLQHSWKVAEAAYPEGHPRPLLHRVNLAAVLRDGGQPELAREHLEATLRATHASNAEIYAMAAYHLGVLQRDAGETEAARATWERALDAPAKASSHRTLARIEAALAEL